MTYDEYFDRYTKHLIDTEFYAQSWEGRVNSLTERVKKRLKDVMEGYGVITSKGKYLQFAKEVSEAIDSEVDPFAKLFDREERKQSEKESDWLGKLLKAFLGITAVMAAMNWRKLKSQPFGKYKDRKDFFESYKTKMEKAVTLPAWSSYIFGSGLSTVSAEMDRTFNKIGKEAGADVHLSVTANQRNTQRLLLEDMRGVSYVYVAILDDKTCPVCGTYSGTVYDDLTKAPLLPIHYNCRCYFLPIRKGEKFMQPSYSEWVEKQDEESKKKILGPARFRLYKSGVQFSEFTSKGHKLTLQELFNDKVALSKPKVPYGMGWETERITKSASVHIAKERIADGIKDPLVYSSDKMMAKTLARETGKDVWLLSERNKGSVNPDAFIDGRTIEFKHVRGGRRKVGLNACRSLLQSENVFLYVEQNIPEKSCLSAIKGALYNTRQQAVKNKIQFIEPNPDGLIFIYTEGKLSQFTWKDVL